MPQTIEERVTLLEQKVAEYEGSQEFLVDQIKGVHRRLIDFERRTGERLDELKDRVIRLEQKVDRLEQKVDRLEQKIDAIIPAVAQVIRDEIAKLKKNP